MIDIKLIRENPGQIKALCKARGYDADIELLIKTDKEIREMQTLAEELSHKLKNARASGLSAGETAEIKQKYKNMEAALTPLKEERDLILSNIPNFMAEDTPIGVSDADNVELYKWGSVPKFDFEPKPHEKLGADLNILDLERGAKVAKSGFYFWNGLGARLAWGLFNEALNFLYNKGFEQMFTPVAAQKRSFLGTGYLPFAADQLFEVKDTGLYLTGTSEQTMVSYFDNEILNFNCLPIKKMSFSPCFRSEKGAYGKQSRGAFRVHQFHKVEQIIFCEPSQSEQLHLECLKNVEEFMQLLELPYRVVRVCSADMGAPGYKKYDVEAWFSGYQTYRETHSNTNLTDYQTRRLNIRCKLNSKTILPHTISSTMITDRALLAIIENNQQKDGSVSVPKLLQKYVNGSKYIALLK